MFSKACTYAIKAMILIKSCNEDKKCSLQEIAKGINSPSAFTAKILQQLRKKGLLVSTIGAKGGFQIPPKKQICLLEIVEAIDGKGLIESCVLGLKKCSSLNPCPVHEKYQNIKNEMLKFMMESSLEDYTEKIKNHTITLK